ncbi:MAG: helix-turn-helix transcriptional regulator [Chloroflexi bacterium]|nr:helix-turn-helix transcriptional regulator [Chloroflexota bacterium]
MGKNAFPDVPLSQDSLSGKEEVDKKAVARSARLLGDTWLLLIICELLEGTKRFGEIQEALGKNNPRGVNPQTLSGRLKQLEHCGIITRKAYAEIPPRVEYELTEKGFGVTEIVTALEAFGQKHMYEEIEATLPCPGSGQCPPQSEF